MKINIATINMQSGVGITRGIFQAFINIWKYWLPHSYWPFQKCGEMIKKEEIGIVCVNEISEKSLRTGFCSQTEILKKSADMNYAHFFSSQKVGKFFFYEGNAILSKYPLANFISHLLPIELMRMALEESVVKVGDKEITIFIAHLALLKKIRLEQIKEIINILKIKKGPLILAGDFNESDLKTFDELRAENSLKQLFTAKTFSAWRPTRSFDYIFLSEDFVVFDCHTQKTPAFSDHLALIVKADIN